MKPDDEERTAVGTVAHLLWLVVGLGFTTLQLALYLRELVAEDPDRRDERIASAVADKLTEPERLDALADAILARTAPAPGG